MRVYCALLLIWPPGRVAEGGVSAVSGRTGCAGWLAGRLAATPRLTSVKLPLPLAAVSSSALSAARAWGWACMSSQRDGAASSSATPSSRACGKSIGRR